MKISEHSQALFNTIKTLPTFTSQLYTTTLTNTLLLTGSSGFLGVHLLEKIISSNFYDKIYLIVRDKNKLLAQMNYYLLQNCSLDNIEIIQGDLIALPEAAFPQVNCVIHSAAQIHGLKNLKQLWENNVLTTKKICDIYQHSAKVYFISTLSVFVSSNICGIHEEKSLDINEDYIIYGGYAQSKFVCEKLVENINGNIIRLGLLTGSTFLGAFPNNDFFTQVIKNLHKLQIYPDNYQNSYVDMTPVDICAQLITDHVTSFSCKNFYHIANKDSLSLSTIIAILKLKKVSHEDFQKAIKDLPNIVHTLLNFAFFKSESLKNHFEYFNIDLFQSTNHSYSIEENFTTDNNLLLSHYINHIIK